MTNARTLRITPAQQSALECAGLDLEDAPSALATAWDGGSRLTVTAETREAIWADLNERSNAEDAAAQLGGDDAVFAGRAARSLYALGSKVLRLTF